MSVGSLAPCELMARRCRSQLLAGPPARHPAEVAGRLLAVQAQDQRGFRLAVRARTTGLRAADVDDALSEERSVVVSWLNRGTLHLVRSEDYWWLHAVTTPPIRAGNDRRLAQTGVTPAEAERGVRVVVDSLGADGPLDRDELRTRLATAGVPTAGQALVHILFKASLDGMIVRGPVRGGRHCFVLVADWLGAGPPLEDEVAVAELARRYLAGHGPATDRDLAAWAGIGLGMARRALRSIGDETIERPGGLVDLVRRASPGDLPPAPTARAVRPAPARLARPLGDPRCAPGRGHRQRPLPTDPPRRRAGPRDLGSRRPRAAGGALRAAERHRRRRRR